MKNDWFALFDELKVAGGFTSDAQLADQLGVTRAQISAWRNGKSDLGVMTKLRIFDALGYGDLHMALDSLLADADPIDGSTKHTELLGRLDSSRRPRSRKRLKSS
jgi:transcriptional regulator with XRE-family HTH domain